MVFTKSDDKKYDIIYADPPWSYRTWNAKGGHKSASAHYNTMDLKAICDLDVNRIASDNCILFLWATYPNLQEALDVVRAWGFTYKTVGFTWVKRYKGGSLFCGLGYYTRSNAEICLIATKGKPKRVSCKVMQAIITVREAHSKKPDEVRDRIVELMGDKPRIELFAREEHFGWDAIGNELNGDDIRDVL